jgi:hypothetical protein
MGELVEWLGKLITVNFLKSYHGWPMPFLVEYGWWILGIGIVCAGILQYGDGREEGIAKN